MGCNVEGRSGTVKAKGFVAELSDRAVCEREREGKDWRGSLFDPDGKIITRCRLQGYKLEL